MGWQTVDAAAGLSGYAVAAQAGGPSFYGGLVGTTSSTAWSRVNAAAALTRWPRRYVVFVLTFLGCVIAYTDRVNISVAAVAMREQFGWSQTQKGVVLAAFFVGYLLFMFVAGLLANRFGGKRRIVGVAVTGWLIDITGTYSAAFVLTATVSAVGALTFGLFADARPIVDLPSAPT